MMRQGHVSSWPRRSRQWWELTQTNLLRLMQTVEIVTRCIVFGAQQSITWRAGIDLSLLTPLDYSLDQNVSNRICYTHQHTRKHVRTVCNVFTRCWQRSRSTIHDQRHGHGSRKCIPLDYCLLWEQHQCFGSWRRYVQNEVNNISITHQCQRAMSRPFEPFLAFCLPMVIGRKRYNSGNF